MGNDIVIPPDLSPEEYVQMGDNAIDGDRIEEAVQWYLKAVELGSAKAMLRMGNCCFCTDVDNPRTEKEAVQWYRKAAELGEPAAQYNLADCY